jgi:multiple antibiotic resistance protein
MLSLPEYSRFAISLFAVLGPVTAVPAFLSHTEGLTSNETSRTAIVAASTAALVLVVAALTGQTILPMLGTSLGSLQIAGGLMMLLMALSRLNPRFEPNPSRVDHGSSTGVVPLGFPFWQDRARSAP